MKPIRLVPVLVALLALLVATAPHAQAAPDATCNVPSAKYPTITKAVNKAKCTDIVIAAGTYHEHDLSVNHNVNIRGAGASTIINGDGQPILYVGYPTTRFTLSNLTLQNAANNGGALALDTNVAATVTGVTFTKNTIGLWMEGGTLQLSHSTFKNNNSLTIGAALFRDGNGGDITIDSTTFKKNKAGCAAAIYSATDSGSAQLIINNSQFVKNTANSLCQGGAIFTQDPTSINGSKFTGNKSTLSGSPGGAIYQTGSGMSISGTTFSNNSAGYGGGIYAFNSINLTLTYNSFDHNVATAGNGGGLYSNSPTVIINTTFSGNRAEGSGVGGGAAFDTASAYLGFLTFAGNTASSGGNLHVGSATVYLKSSLLSQGSPNNCHVTGILTSKGSNLSSDNSCAAYLNQTKDQNNKDPLLGPLAANGGPTKTHALLPGSPAINKSKNCIDAGGSVVLGDQRGVPRPQGKKCDIGAYEKN